MKSDYNCLKEWCKEYGNMDINLLHIETKWIDDKTLGLCTFKNTDGKKWCILNVTNLLHNYPLAYTCVLWHEFCHAELWIKEGKSDGHGDGWVGRCWRKPLLYILDLTYTKILFEILKLKR